MTAISTSSGHYGHYLGHGMLILGPFWGILGPFWPFWCTVGTLFALVWLHNGLLGHPRVRFW